METAGHNTYRVQSVCETVAVNAAWDKPEWEKITPLMLNQYMGHLPAHRPETQVKLGWNQEYIHVIFKVKDSYVRAVATEHHEMVCRDSCVEFFFTPSADIRQGYFNLEINCIGTILLYHQCGRNKDRVIVDQADIDSLKVATSLPYRQAIDPEIVQPVEWTVEYALPWEILKKICGCGAAGARSCLAGKFL
ncbi:MAG: carbohydrate-binding family 9-like protein [Kiritimatiellales bacterium]